MKDNKRVTIVSIKAELHQRFPGARPNTGNKATLIRTLARELKAAGEGTRADSLLLTVIAKESIKRDNGSGNDDNKLATGSSIAAPLVRALMNAVTDDIAIGPIQSDDEHRLACLLISERIKPTIESVNGIFGPIEEHFKSLKRDAEKGRKLTATTCDDILQPAVDLLNSLLREISIWDNKQVELKRLEVARLEEATQAEYLEARQQEADQHVADQVAKAKHLYGTGDNTGADEIMAALTGGSSADDTAADTAPMVMPPLPIKLAPEPMAGTKVTKVRTYKVIGSLGLTKEQVLGALAYELGLIEGALIDETLERMRIDLDACPCVSPEYLTINGPKIQQAITTHGKSAEQLVGGIEYIETTVRS